jgi:probable rRNA maturation factor
MAESEDHEAGAPAIAILVADPAWRRLVARAEATARRAARAALAEAPADAGAGTLSVLLTDDRALRRLNGDHRGIAKPTNVLSFPGETPGHLGDIALALGVVRREAAAAGRRPSAHLAHLVAHGTLHLLGHDHLSAGEARRMERAEARAMARLRLPNPWKPMAAGGAA